MKVIVNDFMIIKLNLSYKLKICPRVCHISFLRMQAAGELIRQISILGSPSFEFPLDHMETSLKYEALIRFRPIDRLALLAKTVLYFKGKL